jgi:hypothetical protein
MLEGHGDAVLGPAPELLLHKMGEFLGPLPVQEIADLIAPAHELRPVAPF